MTNKEMKEWIDNASYEALLTKWRSAPFGSLFFQGEVGDYYSAKMREKQATMDNEELVSISKKIGWE